MENPPKTEAPKTEAPAQPAKSEVSRQSSIPPLQALENLYRAARMAQLSADDHAILTESAVTLKAIVEGLEG